MRNYYPNYSRLDRVAKCSECGALVSEADVKAHDEWHDNLGEDLEYLENRNG